MTLATFPQLAFSETRVFLTEVIFPDCASQAVSFIPAFGGLGASRTRHFSQPSKTDL
jgi:hypothetical protein